MKLQLTPFSNLIMQTKQFVENIIVPEQQLRACVEVGGVLKSRMRIVCVSCPGIHCRIVGNYV